MPRNYFNQVPEQKQPFHNNQFGGSLGGPIIHDKTFFFLDYEAMRETGKEASPRVAYRRPRILQRPRRVSADRPTSIL